MHQRRSPIVIAHRGSSLTLPENTLDAFKLAIEEKADIIECDLRITADKQIIVHHNPRVRSHNKLISKLSLSEIKQIKIPYSHGNEQAEIPTLEELIKLAKGKINVALELKDQQFDHVEYVEKLLKIIGSSGIFNQVIFISFKLGRLIQIKKLAPHAEVGHISFRFKPLTFHETNIECVLWPILFLNPNFVQYSHELGMKVWAMDSLPNVRVGYYINKGVDGILTYAPAQTLEQISKFIHSQNNR